MTDPEVHLGVICSIRDSELRLFVTAPPAAAFGLSGHCPDPDTLSNLVQHCAPVMVRAPMPAFCMTALQPPLFARRCQQTLSSGVASLAPPACHVHSPGGRERAELVSGSGPITCRQPVSFQCRLAGAAASASTSSNSRLPRIVGGSFGS